MVLRALLTRPNFINLHPNEPGVLCVLDGRLARLYFPGCGTP
jgi:hypothetical protein